MEDDRPHRRLENGPGLLHRLHIYPGYDFRPAHQEGTVETQRAITRLVNASQYLPLEASELVVARISEYIAPDSRFYITEPCASVTTEFLCQMRALFIWVESSDLDFGTDVPVARYAVIFCILTGERFRAISLAQVLVDFLATHQADAQVNLTSSCYKFWLGGVMGVMFFDNNLEGAYQRVFREARAGENATDIWRDQAVTFYPPSRAMSVTQRSYEMVYEQTKGLYKRKSPRPRLFTDVTNTM